jgi:hypothetical protein
VNPALSNSQRSDHIGETGLCTCMMIGAGDDGRGRGRGGGVIIHAHLPAALGSVKCQVESHSARSRCPPPPPPRRTRPPPAPWACLSATRGAGGGGRGEGGAHGRRAGGHHRQRPQLSEREVNRASCGSSCCGRCYRHLHVVQFFLLAGRPRLSPLPERELEALRVHATVTTASEDPVGSRSGGGQPPRWLAVGASVRVRVEIMGLIIIRTG